MKALPFTLAVLQLCVWNAPHAAGAVAPEPVALADVAEIAKRALPFIERQGREWIRDRQCVSCHQIPSMLWSLHAAARAGLELDRKQLDEWSQWSADWRHWSQPESKDSEEKAAAGNVDTMAALLLGRDRGAGAATPWVVDFRRHLLKNRQPDGSWKAGGQLPLGKRPARETNEVATMWVLLALKSCGIEDAPLLDAQTRAAGWLAAAKPGQSTEWHALRLLSATTSGRAAALAELLAGQHADGSWGWLMAEPGDALGTGLALYALGRSGVPFAHEAVQRALSFLRTTQRPDGSWPVPSTRAKDKNKVRATSTDWGSAWATAGMLQWLQPPASQN